MTRSKIVSANWKMNKTVAQALAWFDTIQQHNLGDAQVQQIVCVPYVCLPALTQVAQSHQNIAIAAQNVAEQGSGAYTGEVSAEMLQHLGVSHAIVGHSERRSLYHETDETCANKAIQALKHEIVPIFCVGETLEQKQADETQSVIRRQLDALVEAVAQSATVNKAHMIFAYEPVWAIGTGRNATPEDAMTTIAFLREVLAQAWSPAEADAVHILYGGSVNADNLTSYVNNAHVDGVLVGGASLDAGSYVRLVSHMQAVVSA